MQVLQSDTGPHKKTQMVLGHLTEHQKIPKIINYKEKKEITTKSYSPTGMPSC